MKKRKSLNISVIQLIGYSSLIVMFDQLSKYCVIKTLIYESPYAVIQGFLNLTLVFNRGGAFGVLNTKPTVFLFISSLTMVMMFVMCYRMRHMLELVKLPFAMVIGGALGNLIDRFARGYVVDYIDFYIGPYHWPAFNVADTTICLGIFLLLWFLWKEENRKESLSLKMEP